MRIEASGSLYIFSPWKNLNHWKMSYIPITIVKEGGTFLKHRISLCIPDWPPPSYENWMSMILLPQSLVSYISLCPAKFLFWWCINEWIHDLGFMYHSHFNGWFLSSMQKCYLWCNSKVTLYNILSFKWHTWNHGWKWKILYWVK